MSNAQISAGRSCSVDPAQKQPAQKQTAPSNGLGRSVATGRIQVVEPDASGPYDAELLRHLADVDGLLDGTLSDLDQLWSDLPDNGGAVDVLGHCDLPTLVRDLVGGGGKRLRPVMSYLGWLAAGGRTSGVGRADVVRVSAALELLHVFALVHDDVMDESMSRRGRPTVHVQAGLLHQGAGATGDFRRFGDSIAILAGDLAHAEAGNLVGDLPVRMRVLWRLMVAELVAGQRRDLAGSAAGRRDLAFARSVARMKSGRYTVERPLGLGAAAAGAGELVGAALADYGRAVGEAFALRDDLLGVWGDPAETGKPAGDDLISGKPTVILALAHRGLRSAAARAALARVGSPEFDQVDLSVLMRALEDEGIRSAVESRITDHVQTALAALAGGDTALDGPAGHVLDADGAAALGRMAHQIAWRDR